jgi:GxxExxY protein
MDYIRDAANDVFNHLGSGLDSVVYLAALKIHLQLDEQMLEENRSWPLTYDGFSVGYNVSADLVVNQEIVVTITTDDEDDDFDPTDMKRLLKFSGLKEGVVVNFGETVSVIEVNSDNKFVVKRR